jgi:hypothetical protein
VKKPLPAYSWHLSPAAQIDPIDSAALPHQPPAMTLHIIKLCVGADSIEDLQQWIDETQAECRRLGRPAEQIHTTRMAPRRRDEVLDGGSLYWVIRGVLQVRQPIRDLRPVKGDDGIERCEIVLEPVLVQTERRQKRPFQGWRYLAPAEAPRDIGQRGEGGDALPTDMRRALAELGLL